VITDCGALEGESGADRFRAYGADDKCSLRRPRHGLDPGRDRGGATPQDAVRKLKTVEGLTTAPILRDLSDSLGIELPITNGIVEALEGRPIGHVIADFMRRPPTGE
jgi:hypothetical protein